MRRAAAVAAACALLGAALALYAPALRFALAGDDYQWLQLAHRALHRPALLLADLDTFYRPTTTWTLAADRLLWGQRAGGFHLTNLLLHALAAAGLMAAARRLAVRPVTALVVAVLWVASPFTEEPAVSVAIRFEDLLLLAWLAIVVAWPRSGERWSPGRAAVAAAAVALAALSKETWVATPVLIAALELGQRGVPARRAVPATALAAGAAAAYAALYFVIFPGGKGYYRVALAPLAKVPHQLAAFLYFEELRPLAFTFTWTGAVALAAVAATALLGIRHARAPSAVGLALLVAPTIPTLLVPYLPTRYTTIPYAGFLLLAGAVAEVGLLRAPRRLRLPAAAGAAVLAGSVLVAGALTVRADLADLARLSAAHARLVREAAASAPAFPMDRPVLVVRGEDNNPIREVVGSLQGLPRFVFTRHPDPDGLIDAAALFEWVLAREDIRVVRREDAETRFRGRVGAILEHRRDDFVWIAMDVPDLGARVERARLAGLRFRVIEAEPISP